MTRRHSSVIAAAMLPRHAVTARERILKRVDSGINVCDVTPQPPLPHLIEAYFKGYCGSWI